MNIHERSACVLASLCTLISITRLLYPLAIGPGTASKRAATRLVKRAVQLILTAGTEGRENKKEGRRVYRVESRLVYAAEQE